MLQYKEIFCKNIDKSTKKTYNISKSSVTLIKQKHEI